MYKVIARTPTNQNYLRTKMINLEPLARTLARSLESPTRERPSCGLEGERGWGGETLGWVEESLGQV